MTADVGTSTIQNELAALQPWHEAHPEITKLEFETRIEKSRRLFERSEADCLIIGAGDSMRYFSGVGWGPSERFVAMIIGKSDVPVFICPAFEHGSLKSSLAIDANIVCWEEHENPYELAVTTLGHRDIKRLAVDPGIAFSMVSRLESASQGLAIVDGTSIIDDCRMFKSKAEIALMQQAKLMTLLVQRSAARMLYPGISTADVRGFVDAAHRRLGAEGSTVCIALFGSATSYPHGIPDEQYLSEGDFVLIDTGCRVRGYNSDITRTYVFGEPNSEQRRYWQLEQEAQQIAFDAAVLGTPCENVDVAVRRFLTKVGLGPDYRLPGLPHRTGHGIGLSIHEAPYLVRGEKLPLSVGMCFSNEPMIVIPNKFGIRLEDHFYMSDSGAVWFTKPSQSIDKPF